MKFFRRAALLAAVAVFVPAVAGAQAYPVKPVRVMIPWPPGGSNDIVGRVVFQKMSEQLGQQFVIENRGGASGTIGSDLVVKAPPDGYVIMVQSATHVANPHLYKKLPYDTLKDFIGITPLALQVGVVVVHPALPARTTKEFIALAKARPGQITYASSGSGSFVHLAMALLNVMTDTKMVHVPYKGGGPAAIAIASGETQAMAATVGSVIPHIQSKRLRPLGVTSNHRVSQFPDIPTLAEGGVKGYEFTAWIGAFAPAATPRPIVDRLNAELKKAISVPEVAKILSSQTLDPMHMTPEQFAERLRSDYAKYERVIKSSGASID
ncbi:MAG TPA: tripartite tricarboxylate transporter substrate binding protein [Burkholderiales bacterium]|jgi:tripartite-type tricarboxylate transporter receptor subunit TctC|nr:tripartite tricarboxylate transporter substrate binding protein [Burkholderiales bacterium]